MLVNLFINVLLIIYIEKANARIRLKLYRKESNRFSLFYREFYICRSLFLQNIEKP